MKKIAVFTDFSEAAFHAADYAFKLAARLGCDVLLYHSTTMPAEFVTASQVAVSAETFEELERADDHALSALSGKVRQLAEQLPYDSYIPDVHTRSCEMSSGFNFDVLERDPEVSLAVAGMHNKGFSSLFTGNHLNTIVEKLAIPLMIIPLETEFRPWQQVMFASTLAEADQAVVKALIPLIRPFDADLIITHIATADQKNKDTGQAFVTEAAHYTGYQNISYLELWEKRVTDGLEHILQNRPFDMLVMVHHKQNLLQRLFVKSETQSAVKILERPLLVFPFPADRKFQ